MLTIVSYAKAMVSPFALAAERLPRWIVGGVAAFAVAAIPLAAVMAQPAASSFTIAGTGQGFASLQAAVDAIGDGDAAILIAPGIHEQCAIQRSGRIEYRAQEPGRTVLNGTICEGKAALVLRGEAARVTGLTFTNMRVPEKNGAGIRLENGTLDVSQSWFRDSEQGILTVNGKQSRITIDKSTFTRLGTCEGRGGCAHSIYIGDYGELVVTRSRFEEGRGGHYVKSRASRNTISDNSFDDTGGRGTNYMIDLPSGGAGSITGNWFVQGKDKENWSTLIAVGAEGAKYSSDGLVIEGNDARLAPGITRQPVFVADWTGDRLAVGRNALGPNLKPFETR